MPARVARVVTRRTTPNAARHAASSVGIGEHRRGPSDHGGGALQIGSVVAQKERPPALLVRCEQAPRTVAVQGRAHDPDGLTGPAGTVGEGHVVSDELEVSPERVALLAATCRRQLDTPSGAGGLRRDLGIEVSLGEPPGEPGRAVVRDDVDLVPAPSGDRKPLRLGALDHRLYGLLDGGHQESAGDRRRCEACVEHELLDLRPAISEGPAHAQQDRSAIGAALEVDDDRVADGFVREKFVHGRVLSVVGLTRTCVHIHSVLTSTWRLSSRCTGVG